MGVGGLGGRDSDAMGEKSGPVCRRFFGGGWVVVCVDMVTEDRPVKENTDDEESGGFIKDTLLSLRGSDGEEAEGEEVEGGEDCVGSAIVGRHFWEDRFTGVLEDLDAEATAEPGAEIR